MKKSLYMFALLMAGVLAYGQSARVVGYLPAYRFSSSAQIEYCKLTHLNLAFANPDSMGKILMPEISEVVSEALDQNPSVTICISLGGGALSGQQKADWSKLMDIPANRPGLISGIMEYVQENNLHGVDMDLEWDAVTPGYSDFILELDSALSSQNKILTVAFPNQTWYPHVSRSALEAFDFINIMSYDATGPWKPLSPGQHSSMEYAIAGINFWKKTVGINAEHLTLGLPFYGYDFVNPDFVNTLTYASIVALDPAYADLDVVGNLFYNGRSTIASKVALANDEVSGIMVWELGQDSFDEFSLLSTIHGTFTALGTRTSGLCGNEMASAFPKAVNRGGFSIYPNPASGVFRIRGKDIHTSALELLNVSGQVIDLKAKTIGQNELEFDTSVLQPGIYFIMILKEGIMLSPLKLVVL